MPDKSEARVVMVKNIPHGFYERQMLKFFSQFGEVTRLKLLRSKKYLKSKGIAFVEFKYGEIARIAAHTMDNYLMFEKIIKCEVVPSEKVPPGIFRGWKTLGVSSIELHKQKAGRLVDATEWIRLRDKKLKNIKDTQKKLQDLGINYECQIIENPINEEELENGKDLSMLNSSDDATFVSCKSSPSPRLIKTPSKYRHTSSSTSIKKKLMSLPKFVFLRAAGRLSL